MGRLTDLQRECLEWYRDNSATNAIIPATVRWNRRQSDALLEMGLLHVGPGGWHVPSVAGRAALGDSDEQ